MQKSNVYFQILLYCFCALLVVLYVNLYGVFDMANKLLPKPIMVLLPIGAACLSLAIVFYYYFRRRDRDTGLRTSFLVAGGVCCIAALFIPDSQFPAKRIHVVEYMLLVLLVRYVMSWRIQDGQLLLYSVLATVLFGIHDELLQGIHPSRTYGLRDMTVNGVAALGGGLIWHGGSLFTRDIIINSGEEFGRVPGETLYLLWLSAAVLMFIIPLTVYRQEELPYWPLLPLSAAMVFWSCYLPALKGSQRYGCTVLSCLAYLFLLYPVLINATSYTFY